LGAFTLEANMSDEKPKDTAAMILGLSLGGCCALVACFVLVSVGTIVVLALLGPAIGNVFSGIQSGI
jgi:hypothetical protein